MEKEYLEKNTENLDWDDLINETEDKKEEKAYQYIPNDKFINDLYGYGSGFSDETLQELSNGFSIVENFFKEETNSYETFLKRVISSKYNEYTKKTSDNEFKVDDFMKSLTQNVKLTNKEVALLKLSTQMTNDKLFKETLKETKNYLIYKAENSSDFQPELLKYIEDENLIYQKTFETNLVNLAYLYVPKLDKTKQEHLSESEAEKQKLDLMIIKIRKQLKEENQFKAATKNKKIEENENELYKRTYKTVKDVESEVDRKEIEEIKRKKELQQQAKEKIEEVFKEYKFFNRPKINYFLSKKNLDNIETIEEIKEDVKRYIDSITKKEEQKEEKTKKLAI